MALTRQHTRGVLLAAFVCHVVALSCVAADDRKTGKTAMTSYPGLSKAEVLLRIGLAKAGFTYVPSDTGPENSIWPEPVLFNPLFGLWAVDGGADRRSWTLKRFHPGGLSSIDLITALNLQAPQQFVPVGLYASGANVVLLASKRLETQTQSGFVLVAFSGEGKLASSTDLPASFKFDWSAFPVAPGTLLNIEQSEQAVAWYLYPAGESKRRVTGTNKLNRAAQVSGKVVERLGPREFRLLDAQGNVKQLTFKGEGESAGGDPVSGDGPYFGFIETYTKPGDENETTRRLEVMRLEAEGSAVSKLGIVGLPLQKAEAEGASFVLHRPGQTTFDTVGNFYDVAWTPSTVTVYKYSSGGAKLP